MDENRISPTQLEIYQGQVLRIENRLTAVGPHVRPEYNRLLAEEIVGADFEMGARFQAQLEHYKCHCQNEWKEEKYTKSKAEGEVE